MLLMVCQEASLVIRLPDHHLFRRFSGGDRIPDPDACRDQEDMFQAPELALLNGTIDAKPKKNKLRLEI